MLLPAQTACRRSRRGNACRRAAAARCRGGRTDRSMPRGRPAPARLTVSNAKCSTRAGVDSGVNGRACTSPSTAARSRCGSSRLLADDDFGAHGLQSGDMGRRSWQAVRMARCSCWIARIAARPRFTSMPSALMREASVVGRTFSNSAAPPGPNTLPPQASQRGKDIGAIAVAPLVVGQKRAALAASAPRCGSHAAGRQVDPDAAVARQDGGVLDHVLQFAHIAGPGILR